MLRNVLLSLFRPLKGKKSKGSSLPRDQGARFRPVVEQLELRDLPSLVINPTFASSITRDPNAATIESTINTAIHNIENSFTNSITVAIKFQEGAGLGGSSKYYEPVSYTSFRTHLAAAATTSDAKAAVASLPISTNNPVNGNADVFLTLPNARALGYSGANPPPGMPDGTITLNTSICNLNRLSIDPAKYDLLAVTTHEIDEVLGFGSALNGLRNGAPTPTGPIGVDDLWRYHQNGTRSFDTSLADQAYFSINGGTTDLARFNQQAGGDFSDWYSPGGQTPQVQDAFATPGATPDLGVERRRLNVDGYTLIPPVAKRQVSFVLGTGVNHYLYEFVAGVAGGFNITPSYLKGVIASLSDQSIDNRGHVMIDLVTTGGQAYEYHDQVGFVHLGSGVRSAKSGHGVSYVLFSSGVVSEYHDATGHWTQFASGVSQIDAGTDRFGGNAVDVLYTSGADYEHSDATGWHFIASNVRSISAGQLGYASFVTTASNAYLYSEANSTVTFELANVARMTTGTDANGGVMLDALFNNGSVSEWRAGQGWVHLNTPNQAAVTGLSKGRLGLVDLVLSDHTAYEHTLSGFHFLRNKALEAV
jgi:hypothetical protein